MKRVGFLLLAVGIGCLLYVIFSLLTRKEELHSPIPTNDGIKVIFLTPTE